MIMFSAGIAFLVGIVLLQQCVELPHILWALCLLPTVTIFLYKSKNKPSYIHLVCVLMAGFLWALLASNLRMDKLMPAVVEGVDLEVSGYVASLPQQQGRVTRFEFEVTDSNHRGEHGTSVLSLPMRVRLNWYGQASELSVGDKWSLLVRLKAPHGFMNPGGFDYEAWLFSKGIMATGYVRKSEKNKRLLTKTHRFWLERARASIIASLSNALLAAENKGTILALVVGDRQQISQQQWALFRKTGTSHLIAISGLHIGLIAGFMFFMSAYLWRGAVHIWPNVGSLIPCVSFKAMMALLAALLYAALAGFSLPTVRALIMLSAVLLAILLRRSVSAGTSLGLALIAVLLWDPFAVNSAGFWLSFSAVGVLFYVLHFARLKRSRAISMINTQLVLMVALLPISLFWFQYAAVSSSFANLLAIPLVSFLIVPLSLLGTLLLPLSDTLAVLILSISDFLLVLLNKMLQFIADWPLGQWQQHSPSLWALVLAGMGMLMIISPRGLPARWLGLVLLLPLFFAYPDKPKSGEAWFTLLDVGQGLSAVVQTSNHVLVFDVGPKFSEHFDTGAAVVIPFLRAQGLRHVNTLVISHSDNDHIGGAQSLLQEFMPETIYSGEPLKLEGSFKHHFCQQGQRWEWDGVEFEMLYPSMSGVVSGNNASCVLMLKAFGKRIMIPGDIEKQAERQLISSGMPLQADILVAPHHGSRTSSLNTFVASVSPKYALFATGYRNRYGFPKQDIVERYHHIGSNVLSSYKFGAATFKLDAGELQPPVLFRPQQRRYWHHRLSAILE